MSNIETQFTLVVHDKTKLQIKVLKENTIFLHYLVIEDLIGGRVIPISQELFTLLKKELL